MDNGPIVKAKLATKRYVRNYIKYYTPPPLLDPSDKLVNESNNIFFGLDGVESSHKLLNRVHKDAADKSSFSLNVLEKHVSNNFHLVDEDFVNDDDDDDDFDHDEEEKKDELIPTKRH